MKEEKSVKIVIMGIITVLVIIGLVLLLKGVMTGGFVRNNPPAGQPVMYPSDIARDYCELPEPRLDLTKEECSKIGWMQCKEIHGTPVRISMCQTVCGQEIANICRKASGNYGIGLKYTYEPWLGLRRPTTYN